MPILDDRVHDDYAKRLLPRAVGYSAALIDYFFRGKLDLIRDETGPGYIIVNKTNETMEGEFQLFTDNAAGNRTPLLSSSLTLSLAVSGATDTVSGAPLDRSDLIPIATLPPEDVPVIVVFQGRLGNELGAVVGRVVKHGVYVLAIPVDHATRESRTKRYYRVQGDTLAPVAEAALPFGLLDDGAGWDEATMSWKKIDPQGLGIPLGTGGPQYLAKYQDEANQRVRFVSNLSYEKEACQPIRMNYEMVSGVTVSYNRVVYVGSPETAAGMYNENTGWMAYAGAPLNGLVAVLSPPGTDPHQRFFTGYKTANFNDRFIEAPKLAYYGFDNRTAEQDIVKDPEAPLPAVVSVSRSSGTRSVKVAVPTIFDSYVMPHPTRTPPPGLASSGLDLYTYTVGAAPVLDGSSPKCTGENNNCGAAYDPSQGLRSVGAVYDIPSNDDSMVRVHFGDNGEYYEELFINGILVQSSTPSADRLETHYQILAAHGGVAVVRITSFAGQQEQALPYWHQSIGERIIDRQIDFVSAYAVYVNGARYDLPGTTNVRSHYLATRYEQGMDVNTLSPVRYLTYDIADDITGFHPDRIFINETFDSRQVLVAFDEYAYNNGEGFLHQLKYQPISAAVNADRMLFFDIATAKLQNADHEAVRSGRKLLLFNGDGTLRTVLQDPIGLNDSIGSIGILN